MDKEWFEMHDLRKKQFNKSVWIPLHASVHKIEEGKYGHIGYKNEFFGLGSVLLPFELKDKAKDITWCDLGISHSHGSYMEDDKYYPADYFDVKDITGIYPVIIQESLDDIDSPWLLNQDILVALALREENNIWVCPENGYEEAIRLQKNENGRQKTLEIKANYLKDYLCARNMFLYITSYSERKEIIENVSNIVWKDDEERYISDLLRWEGRVFPIHEGGNPYGESTLVFQVERTDVNDDDDIPDLSAPPNNENIKSMSYEKRFEGKKLYFVSGELWYNELIMPGNTSPIVRGDIIPSTNYFIIDQMKNKISGDELKDSGKWLWFSPNIIATLSNRRYFSLSFCSKNTGSVSCLYGYYVHFGINELGLINVFSEDISILPDWQQKIWAGYNVMPEGGVSKELLASQVHANPVDTQAPEEFILDGLNYVNYLSKEKLGIEIFKIHDILPELIKKTNRFRSLDLQSFFSLAKDLTRITVDSLDITSMQKIIKPLTKEKWGSIKTLENVLAQKIESDFARKITSRLVGIYELRLADAHLPSNEIDEAFSKLNIDRTAPFIIQGYQLLNDCVSCIYEIVNILKIWDK